VVREGRVRQVSAGFGELRPELMGQFQSKIEGLLSGETNVMGTSGWHLKGSGDYNHFEITNIEPYGHGYEATAQVYFPDKVESLYIRTDSSAEKITELSMGFPLPGTSPDDQPKKEPVDPKRRRAKPGKGTGK
jgi:hypothetical protein